MLARKLITAAFVLALLPALLQCKSSVGNDAQATPPKAAQRDAANGVSGAAAEGARVVLEPLGAASVSVRVEIAETPEQRQQGLMYRRQLDPDAGMLFLFERPQHNSFWMRNTYVPLDMIFITPDWKILGIVENATPQTDDPRSVPGDSQYVLEVNAGFSRSHQLAPGTVVRFQRDAR
jgi:uncharacterized membrane protein (UPF0127 family)